MPNNPHTTILLPKAGHIWQAYKKHNRQQPRSVTAIRLDDGYHSGIIVEWRSKMGGCTEDLSEFMRWAQYYEAKPNGC